MASRPAPKPRRTTRSKSARTKRVAKSTQISSEEAIRAGEQIAMAAFASGLKLAAAFGTVAAKTAGLALQSMASGADKFSQLVREEALRSYSEDHPYLPKSASTSPRKKSVARRLKR